MKCKGAVSAWVGTRHTINCPDPLSSSVMYTEMNAGCRMSATDVMYTDMNAGSQISATDVIQPALPHDYAMLAVNTVRGAWGHCSRKE